MTTDKTVTLPIDIAERLVDLAASAPGNNNVPVLQMFAEVRRLIEVAKRG